MMKLDYYMKDGACWQARAVLAYLQAFGQIEESWNKETKEYDAEIKVGRWENCREQGYVVMLVEPNYKKQLNIAFFEHRNSDNICAVKWIQSPTLNSVNLSTAKFGDVYKDKYDTSFSVSYSEITKMGDWILNELKEFWLANPDKKKKDAVES
jgi:hypothetical protein